MAEAALFTATFSVGRRYTCTLTFPPVRPGEARHMVAEWAPRVPHRLTKKEVRAYRAGRDKAALEYAERCGVRMLLAEV